MNLERNKFGKISQKCYNYSTDPESLKPTPEIFHRCGNTPLLQGGKFYEKATISLHTHRDHGNPFTEWIH